MSYRYVIHVKLKKKFINFNLPCLQTYLRLQPPVEIVKQYLLGMTKIMANFLQESQFAHSIKVITLI